MAARDREHWHCLHSLNLLYCNHFPSNIYRFFDPLDYRISMNWRSHVSSPPCDRCLHNYHFPHRRGKWPGSLANRYKWHHLLSHIDDIANDLPGRHCSHYSYLQCRCNICCFCHQDNPQIRHHSRCFQDNRAPCVHLKRNNIYILQLINELINQSIKFGKIDKYLPLSMRV